ncbi:MAG: hypothetical protein KAR38_08205, partial [Calditrichia bacterium]|nr:hypothetical protein [Calditrichia bacterium]
MKKFISIISIIFFFILLLVNCTENGTNYSKLNNNTQIREKAINLNVDDKKILMDDSKLNEDSKLLCEIDKDLRLKADEIRLKYFAKALAIAIEDKEVYKIIEEATSKKFDGDTEILWEMVKDETLPSGLTIRRFLNNKFNKDQSSILSIEELEKVNLLNILFCRGFKDNYGKEGIKVAFVPITKNDIEIEKIIAYDSELKEHEVYDVSLNFPLIVIGINERVNPKTKKVDFDGIDNEEYDENDLRKTVSDYSNGWALIVNEIWLYEDHEPIWLGNAEIYFIVSGYDNNGNLIDTDYPEFEHMNHDDPGYWYYTTHSWLPKYFWDSDNASLSPYEVSIKVMERDSGDDDRIEQYWTFTNGNYGSIKIQVFNYYRTFYGGGNDGDSDLVFSVV